MLAALKQLHLKQASFAAPPSLKSSVKMHAMQVDGFNKALTSRSSGKGFGRLLSFTKSPRPAASPATPEHLALSMDDMLLYNKASICLEINTGFLFTVIKQSQSQ